MIYDLGNKTIYITYKELIELVRVGYLEEEMKIVVDECPRSNKE